AEQLLFAEDDTYRAGLVATELATNIVKHATGGGEMLVRGLTDDIGASVEMIALDRGPGMTDVDACFRDGVSTTGTMGAGLGGVSRLADEFDMHSEPGRGTAVLARVRAGHARGAPAGRMQCAGVARAVEGEPVCGDAWTWRAHDQGYAVVIADGLGHGLQAAHAASTAVDIFEQQPYATGLDMLRLIHRGLAHTRGAAATIVDIRPAEACVKVTGIGNVAAVLAKPGYARAAVALPGVLGHQARQFRDFFYPWSRDTLVVVHSDGLSNRWTIDAYRGLYPKHPALIAAVLYRDCQRGRDDASVVVVRAG
ncbi:MAG: SpoIIE family protein phosphatase, partial [Vicinamibacterales bacterium]